MTASPEHPSGPEPDGADDSDVDGRAYDAFLDALEAGAACDVGDFLEAHPGASDDLRRRLERLSRRFGRGLERPTDIGGLRVLGVLGSGGMGEVFEARDEALDRTVAVKVLTRTFAADPARIQRFEREARILAALDHPNVATIHALGRSAGAPPHIVMERVDGEDVARVLERGALEWRAALDLCEQVAGALEAAHERGIVHRDLKPSNVMLRPDGVVKVLDFGLAERMADGAHGAPGPVVGTPGYMSPEQARGEPPDERADVWSFGCIARECLTGERARRRTSSGGAARGGEGQAPAWPDAVPPSFVRLVESCLASERERRPADGAALVRAIGAIRDGLGRGDDDLPAVPAHRTTFIGRAREKRDLDAALQASALVSLVGPGGAGKSRLAVEVARTRSPVAWAELASVGADGVAGAFLRAIGVRPGVAEDPLDDVRAAYARRSSVLLVVDNCEHVLEAAAAAVVAALDASPDVRVLVTSREPLGLRGERVLRLEPLGLPARDAASCADAGALLASDAVALFVERAAAAGCPPLSQPDDPESNELGAAAELCRRLDGLPLAIELAAARAATVGVAQLLARLDDRDGLLRSETRDGLAHHRSLAALVDWSHELLSGTERVLLRRLSVFANGWTLASAEDVAAADGLGRVERRDVLVALSRLTARSLVTRDATGGRWRFLETLREYARARLEARPECTDVRAAHARHFLELAETAVSHSFDSGRLAAFLELERELPDLLVALRHALGAPDLALRSFLASSGLFEFWISRGLLREGVEVLGVALAAGVDVTPSQRGFAVLAFGTLQHRMGRYAEGARAMREALTTGEQTGDRSLEARARRNLGFLQMHQEDFDEARDSFEAALEIERDLGDRYRISNLLNDLGILAVYERRYEDAVDVYSESLALRRAVGDVWGVAGSLGNIGEANHRLGRHRVAREQLSESLAGFRDLGDLRSAAESFEMSAALEVSDGDLERATRLSGAAEGLRERFGFPIPKAEAGPYAEDVRRMREGLDDGRYEELRAEGKSLSLDAAIALALGDQPPRS